MGALLSPAQKSDLVLTFERKCRMRFARLFHRKWLAKGTHLDFAKFLNTPLKRHSEMVTHDIHAITQIESMGAVALNTRIQLERIASMRPRVFD